MVHRPVNTGLSSGWETPLLHRGRSSVTVTLFTLPDSRPIPNLRYTSLCANPTGHSPGLRRTIMCPSAPRDGMESVPPDHYSGCTYLQYDPPKHHPVHLPRRWPARHVPGISSTRTTLSPHTSQLHVPYSAYLTWHTKRQSRKLPTRFLTSCRTKHRTLSDIIITCSRNASSRTDTVPVLRLSTDVIGIGDCSAECTSFVCRAGIQYNTNDIDLFHIPSSPTPVSCPLIQLNSQPHSTLFLVWTHVTVTYHPTHANSQTSMRWWAGRKWTATERAGNALPCLRQAVTDFLIHFTRTSRQSGSQTSHPIMSSGSPAAEKKDRSRPLHDLALSALSEQAGKAHWTAFSTGDSTSRYQNHIVYSPPKASQNHAASSKADVQWQRSISSSFARPDFTMLRG